MVEVTAPMVGKVVKVLVAVGEEVEEDQPIIMLEAMKVEMPVVAPDDGKVASINVQEGDTVDSDQVLASLE